MNIVIIEDEVPARERLEQLLASVMPSARVIAHHDTVKGAGKWFAANPFPDLVLLDVQLADGTAFDLLDMVKINCPIIFTTAYSKFALNAFKAKSIDYLLKPIKQAELEQALLKLKEFKEILTPPEAPIRNVIAPAAEYKKRFIIRLGEHIRTLAIENIAYFLSENKNTFARTFDGLNYPMDHNLDALELMVDPQSFFRINRQFLISLKSIKEMKVYTKSRVIVKLEPTVKEPPIVSSERSAEFKLWLAGELN
jgi:two-component system LytT family response regulator